MPTDSTEPAKVQPHTWNTLIVAGALALLLIAFTAASCTKQLNANYTAGRMACIEAGGAWIALGSGEVCIPATRETADPARAAAIVAESAGDVRPRPRAEVERP